MTTQSIDILDFLDTTYLTIVTYPDNLYAHNVAYALAVYTGFDKGENNSKKVFIVTKEVEEVDKKIEANVTAKYIYTLSYDDLFERTDNFIYDKINQAVIIYDEAEFISEDKKNIIEYLYASNNYQIALSEPTYVNENLKTVKEIFDGVSPQLISFNPTNMQNLTMKVTCVPCISSDVQEGSVSILGIGSEMSLTEFVNNNLQMDEGGDWLREPVDFITEEGQYVSSDFGKALRFYNIVYPNQIQKKIFTEPEKVPSVSSLLEIYGWEKLLENGKKIETVIMNSFLKSADDRDRHIIYTAFDDIFGGELILEIIDKFENGGSGDGKYKVPKLSDETTYMERTLYLSKNDDEYTLKEKIMEWNTSDIKKYLIVATPNLPTEFKYKIKNVNKFHILDYNLGQAYDLALDTFKMENRNSLNFEVFLYYSLVKSKSSDPKSVAEDTANSIYMKKFSDYLERFKNDKIKRFNYSYSTFYSNDEGNFKVTVPILNS